MQALERLSAIPLDAVVLNRSPAGAWSNPHAPRELRTPAVDRLIAKEKELGANIRAYQVNFKTFEAFATAPQQCAMPSFLPDPNGLAQFTLTCATEGASIYYTTDESYPAPGREGSTLYVAPIAIPESGISVRAAAYLTGYIASGVNRASVTLA